MLTAAITCYSLYASAQEMTNNEKIQQVLMISSTESLPMDQLSWLNNCLDRCIVLPITSIASSITVGSVSDLTLLDKYGAILSYDYEYDASTFNPLKYMINFYATVDQYFRIGDSEYVLKVNKKY